MTAPAENLVALWADGCERFGARPLFGEKMDGAWVWTTYAEFRALVDAFRGGLASLGVAAGDRVAIVSRNRVAWAVAAYATYGLEATFVPMYEAQRPEEWRFILDDCGAKVVLGSGEATVATLDVMKPGLPALEHVVAIDGAAGGPRSYATLCERGRAHPVAAREPAPDAIAGIIYTSGTTGRPKGALLSHHNLTSNVLAACAVFPIAPDDRSVSFLPWAHVYGQVVELHILMHQGASTAFATDLASLPADLVAIRPTILVAVPRIFNRIHDAVHQQIAARGRLIRALFHAGLRTAQGGRPRWRDHLAHWLADHLIFRKVRARFGGRLRYAISASASLSRDVAEFVDAMGIPVYEGYGLTETSPVVSTNRPGARRMGSVGQPIPGVTVEIDPSRASVPGEGEIVVHGPNVMRGYHRRDEETAEALTADGGLRTGDLGHVDADGYVYITGRLKEQFKLENGKYVMPAPLEQQLALSPFISTVMLIGDGRPHCVALVALDLPAVRAWAERAGRTLADDPAQDPAVHELIAAELEHGAAGFKPYERPRAFTMVTETFTIENDLLTPTLKLKRRNVLLRWGAQLDALYPPPAWAATVPVVAAAAAPPAARPH